MLIRNLGLDEGFSNERKNMTHITIYIVFITFKLSLGNMILIENIPLIRKR